MNKFYSPEADLLDQQSHSQDLELLLEETHFHLQFFGSFRKSNLIS